MSISSDGSVVVLGRTGFIGGALARFLKGQGFSVRAASSNECDLTDPGKIKDCLDAAPGPFRLVYAAAAPRRKDETLEHVWRNVQMARNLADVLADRPPQSLIYLSSADVYGLSPALPVTEKNL